MVAYIEGRTQAVGVLRIGCWGGYLAPFLLLHAPLLGVILHALL